MNLEIITSTSFIVCYAITVKYLEKRWVNKKGKRKMATNNSSQVPQKETRKTKANAKKELIEGPRLASHNLVFHKYRATLNL